MLLTKKRLDDLLTEQYKTWEMIPRAELYRFFQQYDPDLNEGTFGWRIYDLRKRQIIKDVKRGYYAIQQGMVFRPTIDKLSLRLGKLISTQFEEASYCLLHTAWFNEMIELQATQSLYVLYVEKAYTESAFHLLIDEFPHVYLKPDATLIHHYVSEKEQAIVIEPMVSRAPIVGDNPINISSIEKILVDLFCDSHLYYAYQGKQLLQIYTYCFAHYGINFSTLFNYARRRNKEVSIHDFIMRNHRLKELTQHLNI